MKIAFVGKGGSGKSTLTSLFVRYLQQHNNRSILAIDADLNMNLAGLLGANVSEKSLMARPDVADAIRQYLKGSNSRVQDTAKFLPTTPPGNGSHLIRSADDSAIAPYAVRISDRPLVNLLTVGTYDSEGIGQTCYHSHLFVAENLLSHIVTNKGFSVVCDMVAGTDAFAYSMHLQFDAIILIAEPTPESVEVCRLYLNLAQESGVDKVVHLIGNKIEDENDLTFITQKLGRELLSNISLMPSLKKARQQGNVLDKEIVEPELLNTMRKIDDAGQSPLLTPADRMAMLHSLHHRLNAKKWVQLGYGDVAEQIDPNFQLYGEAGILV